MMLPAPLVATVAVVASQPPPAVIQDALRPEPSPSGGAFEYGKRILAKGAAIGLHRLSQDEVYYVLSGRGEVTSDGTTATLAAGMAAYLYHGAEVGIRQVGDEALVLVIACPLEAWTAA